MSGVRISPPALKTMKKSLIHASLAIAHSKKESHPEFQHFIHFTFIVQDNKIVEWGRNHKGEPALHHGYRHGKDFQSKIHSEMDAYKKAKGLLDKTKPFEIINIRLNKKGLLRLSKPCKCCFNLMKEFGCRTFYYSSEIGFLKIR